MVHEEEMILISSCLAGINVKYNGDNNNDNQILARLKWGRAIAVCPEVMGGLSTPRPPCEIVKDESGQINVMDQEGIDVTKAFILGAEKALALCQAVGINKAVLQKRSPSCGVSTIYDGKFSGNLIDGNGITAQSFIDAGIKVYTPEQYIEEQGSIMCWCAGITDKDIDRQMSAMPKADTATIMAALPWSNRPNCKNNNPTGKCCKGAIRTYINTHQANNS